MTQVEERPAESLVSTVTLSVVQGPATGTRYRYSERTTAIAGRADDCDPRIDEPGPWPLVSRHHCLFDINPPAVRVRDFGSRNGTRVNGEEIGRRERDLVDGDRITLGGTVLLVEVTGPPRQRVSDHLGGEVVLPEISGYSLLEELGRGGQGVVYRARQHHSGELIALKMMLAQVAVQPRAQGKFRREIAAVQALDHPNILSLCQAGNIGAAFFFTSKYCSGGSIHDLVARDGPVPPDRAVPLVLQALDGLDHAHTVKLPDGSVGLVHRDLKPANILLDGKGADPVVKIADFGLAKAFDRAGLSGLTLTGAIEGTMSFMARSQIVNFKRVRPDVDVWAMAATLYFMLTGSPPREFPLGVDPVQIVLEEDPVPIRERNPAIPKALAAVIDAALVDQPRDAVTCAAQLAAALREAL